MVTRCSGSRRSSSAGCLAFRRRPRSSCGPFIGAASDRIGRRAIIVVGLLVSASGVLLLASAATASGLIVAIATYASGAATTTAATSAYITDITRRERYGAAHGVFGTIYDVGDALGPLAAGLLVTAVGYSGMFRVMAFVAIATAAAFALGSRASLRHS